MTGNLFCAALTLAGLAALTACSGEPENSAAAPRPPGTTSKQAAADVPAAQRLLTERFVQTINRGDRDGVGALFAEKARFDSVGRVYRGRNEIMGRFLGPEVIEAGGRYKLLSVRPGRQGRAVAEYDFTTSGGSREHFTYDCAVSGAQFTDCVGRYV